MALITNAATIDQLSQDPAQNLVIADCRFSLADSELGYRQYLAGHIPGAYHLDMERHLSGPKSIHGGRHPLPSAAMFNTTMQQIGVDETTLVVAYDDNKLAGAARLWWLLQYFGHQRILILDGGLQAWQDAGLPLSQKLPQAQPGCFQADPKPENIRDYGWLRERLGLDQIQLIDSRETARYQGLEEPIDPIAGHIPGALNYPWQQVTDAAGHLYPVTQQQERWRNLHLRQKLWCIAGLE